MKERDELTRLRQRLIKRRDAIFKAHRRTEEQRRTLLEPEIEFEESSQKESLSDVMASFDEQEEREIEAIDRALTRIDVGDYRVCESCGRKISLKRLRAIPWTTECARCAGQGAQESASGLQREEAGPDSVGQGETPRSDEIKAIFSELREDGGVDTDELRISLWEGSVHLEGVLPTEAQHGRLLEVVQDHVGLASVVDEIVVNPLPWERPNRTSGTKTIDEIAAEFTPEEEDLGVSPPDTLQPEESKS